MAFESDKQIVLAKEDKSLKGSIDGHIQQLCEIINSKDSFYTTSSCSGRIVLLKMPDSGLKNEAEWLLVSHDEVGEYAIESNPEQIPPGEIWFRFEPLILHVACRTIDDASRLLTAVQGIGIKRSGIISLSKKIVVEIIGTESIDTPVAKDGRLLVDPEYIAMLTRSANTKIQKNWQNIEKIKSEIERL